MGHGEKASPEALRMAAEAEEGRQSRCRSMAGCIEGAVDVLAASVAAAAFGVLLTALSITGTHLYGLRALGSRKPATGETQAPRNAAEAPSFTAAWRIAWQAMRHWRWLWLRLAAIWLWLMQAEIAK